MRLIRSELPETLPSPAAPSNSPRTEPPPITAHVSRTAPASSSTATDRMSLCLVQSTIVIAAVSPKMERANSLSQQPVTIPVRRRSTRALSRFVVLRSAHQNPTPLSPTEQSLSLIQPAPAQMEEPSRSTGAALLRSPEPMSLSKPLPDQTLPKAPAASSTSPRAPIASVLPASERGLLTSVI